jgi:hypothetical protein
MHTHSLILGIPLAKSIQIPIQTIKKKSRFSNFRRKKMLHKSILSKKIQQIFFFLKNCHFGNFKWQTCFRRHLEFSRHLEFLRMATL